MLGLKLNHVSKRGHRGKFHWKCPWYQSIYFISNSYTCKYSHTSHGTISSTGTEGTLLSDWQYHCCNTNIISLANAFQWHPLHILCVAIVGYDNSSIHTSHMVSSYWWPWQYHGWALVTWIIKRHPIRGLLSDMDLLAQMIICLF